MKILRVVFSWIGMVLSIVLSLVLGFVEGRTLFSGDWKLAEKRRDPESVQGRIYQALLQLEKLRREHPVFTAAAGFSVLNTANDHVLGIRREYEGQHLYAYFNFSEQPQNVYFDTILTGRDLVTGEEFSGLTTELKPYGFLWILIDE